ncbi:TIGR01457 family HAD-type hydrolase [Pullulanibacillus sp. KACC 23026]|uniref:TIGR01457 family HAD-type hydrolase n=1 Tax=Pullulanibacillus sp. KACC 23026 TaxID=3028315 RepID=UPI0023B002C8|nr:TIGR01457 family HAD-type hydrolase [Pullulanibacillus sp. KACC 23026]WEG13777.1 TIGR01457 family HAD-type hydrolase [Pullulanibacillus sp. KACC 23026]
MRYKGYLIDLDGTIYKGNEPIPEAIAFVKELESKKIPYLYVTNNSTTTPEKVAERLQKMGAPADKEHVLTTSQASASFIAGQAPGASVYYIGEEGLKIALEEAGLQVVEEAPSDYVVIGLDRGLTYEKLTRACLAIRGGAQFVSTNSDVALPTERGLALGNGAITESVSVSTGVAPIYIGKPESIIVDEALKRIGCQKSEVIMVGDNYDTDMLAGIRAGVDTLFVSTGVTKVEELNQFDEQPTYSLTSLKEWSF